MRAAAWFALLTVGCSALVDLSDLRGGPADATAGEAGSDASDASPPLAIQCNSQVCDPSSSVCCAACDAHPCTMSCLDSAASCGSSNVVFQCSDPGSCQPGDVCCGSNHDSYFHGSQCMTQNQCDALQEPLVLCDPNASTCPSGASCLQMGSAYLLMFTCQSDQ